MQLSKEKILARILEKKLKEAADLLTITIRNMGYKVFPGSRELMKLGYNLEEVYIIIMYTA